MGRTRSYVETNHDHLGAKKKGILMEAKEKIVFSENVIRVDTTDNKGKVVTGVEECVLVLTNRGMMEFVPGDWHNPTVKILYGAIAGVSQSKLCKMFYFKDIEKQNRRYVPTCEKHCNLRQQTRQFREERGDVKRFQREGRCKQTQETNTSVSLGTGYGVTRGV